MNDKLCVSERRTRIVEFLSQVKSTTRIELATRFEVSVETINRDIMYISKIAPIYTKQGNGGGVYILPEYKSYKNYLTETEEKLLCCLIEKVSKEERRLLCEIIIKFARYPIRDMRVFKIHK